MIEWLLSYLRRMTDEQKLDLAKAFFAPSELMYLMLEEAHFTVAAVDAIIQRLEEMSKEERAKDQERNPR